LVARDAILVFPRLENASQIGEYRPSALAAGNDFPWCTLGSAEFLYPLIMPNGASLRPPIEDNKPLKSCLNRLMVFLLGTVKAWIIPKHRSPLSHQNSEKVRT
jgi:hypothetical protein